MNVNKLMTASLETVTTRITSTVFFTVQLIISSKKQQTGVLRELH